MGFPQIYHQGENFMTNKQARLIASAIALLAGGVIANASSLDVNISIIIILLSSVLFVVEYLRCLRD